MRRFFFSLLLVSFFITACQDAPAPQPPRGLGGVAMEQEENVVPTITVSETSGGPNAAVIVSGENFPSDTFVEIRLGTAAGIHPHVYAQLLTDEIGSFAISLTMPTLWPETLADGQADLIIQAQTLTAPVLTAEASFSLDYTNAFQSYTANVGGFTVLLPQGWQVSDPQSTPLGTMFLLGREPLVPGDPAVSTILISEDLTPIRAAEQLICGGGCLEAVRLERLDWNGQLLYKTPIISEGSPTLQWYFFPQEKRLVYWSLHDPVTFETLPELFPTFDLLETEIAAAEPTAANTVTPSPTPMPQPTATPTLPAPVMSGVFADITAEAGPIQVTSEFLLAMLRLQIFTVAEARPVFNEAYYRSLPADASLLDVLQLEEMFAGFNVVRLRSEGVMVRLELTQADGQLLYRYAVLERDEVDGIWRITSISADETTLAATPAETAAAVTSTAEVTVPSEEQVTVTPEAAATLEITATASAP